MFKCVHYVQVTFTTVMIVTVRRDEKKDNNRGKIKQLIEPHLVPES